MGQRHGLLVAAAVLISAGLLGAVVTAALLGVTTARDGRGRYSGLGERIYFTGVGESGRISIDWNPTRWMMGPRQGLRASPFGCVRCHKADGGGGPLGMMTDVEVPDIRYRTLTAPHQEGGRPEAAWSEADIAEAITEGTEPTGEQLDPLMPRWDMTDREVEATIEYLKELDSR